MQLFLTLFSLPILLRWGLPLSWLTMLGNIIWSPCIALFLLLSALLFFAELFALPCALIAWGLEKLTNLWLMALSWGDSSNLVAFADQPWWILIWLPLGALFIVFSTSKATTRVFLLSGWLFVSLNGLRLLTPTEIRCSIPYGTKNLLLICQNGKSSLIDVDGSIRGGKAGSFAIMLLRTELARKAGLLSCDELVCTQPTPRRLLATQELARALHIPVVIQK